MTLNTFLTLSARSVRILPGRNESILFSSEFCCCCHEYSIHSFTLSCTTFGTWNSCIIVDFLNRIG